MNYVVYKITRIDDLSYIGITANFITRLWNHRKSKRFSSGIKSYEILNETDDYLIAEKLEEEYISFYDTWKCGLNVTFDGKGYNGNCNFNTCNYKYSEESKNKMKKNHWSKTGKYSPKGSKHSEETKEKISNSKKGKPSFTKISENDVIKMITLYYDRPEIKDVGKIRRNGKILTYMRAFSKKHHLDFGLTSNALYKILNGEIAIWKPLLLEIEKNYKY
jgi:hypothetical protein